MPDMGRGIIAPANSDNIGTGASEMRTLASTAATAIDVLEASTGAALDGKVGTGDPRLSDARTPLAHTHPMGDVSGLATALASKRDNEAAELGADTDLNTLTTPGQYVETSLTHARTHSNIPEQLPYVLDVAATGNRSTVWQIWRRRDAPARMWMRTNVSGAWATWERLWTAEEASTDREMLRRGVSVREFGATGDGATDDTQAFTAALASGGPVHVPGGTYRVSGAYASGPVDLTMANDAVIQHDATGPGILIEGTETPAQTEAGITLSGDVQTGATSFVALGHGLSPGDYFRLGSELPWDASSTNIRQGEILRVATVSGSGFTSTTPVMGGPYLRADSAAIWRLGMIEGVTIRGGTIRGPRTPNLVQTGLLIRRARDVEVVGTRFESIDYRHVSLEDVVDGHMVRTDHDWAQDAGMAYGIAVTGACQNVTISRGTFVDTRHAVTTSNLMAVRGVARFLTVSDCVVRRTLPALNENQSGGDAFDTHTAADYVTFDRNVVEGSSGGGINVECRHSRVRWNTIIAPTGTGIHVHNESDYDGSTEIIGNHVVAGPATTYGIRVSPASRGSGKTLRGVIVSANTVKGVQSTPIYMGSAANAPLYAIALNGNVFVDCPGAYMVRQVNGYGVAATGNTSDKGQATLRLEDNAPKGDDAGFEYGRFDGETITVTPTGRYIQLTGSTGDQSLTTINGAARGQFITLIAPLNGNRITISTAGHIYLPTPLSIAGRETVTLAYNGFTWSEVSRSLGTVIAYDTDGVPYLAGV